MAYLLHPSEVAPLCRSAGLEVIEILKVEGLVAMSEETSLFRPAWRAVIRKIALRLADSGVSYAVVGGACLTLQGVPLPVKDVDLEMSAEDVYRFQDLFQEYMVKPVGLSESATYRSHFGRFNFDGVLVEVMGDLHRREENKWVPTATSTRRSVDLDGIPVTVAWLEEETLANMRRGRLDRAGLCLPYCNPERLRALLSGRQPTQVI